MESAPFLVVWVGFVTSIIPLLEGAFPFIPSFPSLPPLAFWGNSRKKEVEKRDDSGIMSTGGERMNLLPNAESAVIPDEKLNGYALNPEREPNKAKAFQEALGYNLSNSDSLKDNIRSHLLNFEAIEKPDNGYGKRYDILMTLTGANGRTANVKTAWIVDKKTGETRLISTYVTKKRFKEVP